MNDHTITKHYHLTCTNLPHTHTLSQKLNQKQTDTTNTNRHPTVARYTNKTEYSNGTTDHHLHPQTTENAHTAQYTTT